MVRHGGPADCTEVNRVELGQCCKRVRRHHRAGALVTIGAPIQLSEVQGWINRRENANTLGNDLLPDSVTCDDRNSFCDHRILWVHGGPASEHLAMENSEKTVRLSSPLPPRICQRVELVAVGKLIFQRLVSKR